MEKVSCGMETDRGVILCFCELSGKHLEFINHWIYNESCISGGKT